MAYGCWLNIGGGNVNVGINFDSHHNDTDRLTDRDTLNIPPNPFNEWLIVVE
jgi:hypothetical protein